MAYRPKIKDDVNGTVSDLALDAETVQGIDVVDRLKSVPLYVTSVTGTAAVTTSGSYYHAKWTLTDSRISNLYDGLRVSFKIPVAGNGSYGTGVCINSGNYHPVVFNVNSMVGTRYGVNSTMTLVYNSTQTGTLYINNTSTTITGVWQIEDYDSNTTTTYGTLNYYMRPYVGANRLTAYKIVALDKDNRVIPITTEQYMGTYSTSTTYSKDDIVVSSSKYYKSLANSNKNKAVSNTSYWTKITMPSQFTPNTTAFKPDKIYFYNTTAGIAAGAVIGGQTLTEIGYNTSVCAYTFWASITAYKMIYLQGTYNTTTGLFTLDTGANYYKLVPNNTANLTLSSYFSSGKDYIFVGATYSSANYFQLAMVNIMYHFDGTNLVQYDTYRANTIVASIPSPVTESTVSGWGFTKNTGTVTSVSAGTGLSISGTATTTPTVNVASGYKLLTTTEYNTLDAKVSNVQSDWNATSGLSVILNKPSLATVATSGSYSDLSNKPSIFNFTGVISTQIITIKSLETGIYLLTYNGTKKIKTAIGEVSGHELILETTTTYNNILVVSKYSASINGHILPRINWKLICPYNSTTLYKGVTYQYQTEGDSGTPYWTGDVYNERFVEEDICIYYGDSSSSDANYYYPLYRDSVTTYDTSSGQINNRYINLKKGPKYAGGTAVTLNGTSKSATTASFYAPTSSGTSGQFLKSAGANASPTWETVTIPTKSSWNYDDMYVKYSASQSLTDAQKTQARSNIGAGTSSFTGYTSSNKLSTDYINNAAGWTSNAGTVTSVRVQAGTGLASSTSTAQTATLNTTISIASDYKLPTRTEWDSKANSSALGDQVTYSYSGGVLTITSK